MQAADVSLHDPYLTVTSTHVLRFIYDASDVNVYIY
jgi:hypothetical protein